MTRDQRIKLFRRQMLRQRVTNWLVTFVPPVVLTAYFLAAVCRAVQTPDSAYFMALWAGCLVDLFLFMKWAVWIKSRG